MKANAATMSRRRMLANVPAVTAALGLPASAGTSADDPVFAAIERHRQAAQAAAATAHEPADALLDQLVRKEGDALLAWLTTPPTTMAGVIATLEHASQPSTYGDEGDECTNLMECEHCHDEMHVAGEQFPAMIATALRKIVS